MDMQLKDTNSVVLYGAGGHCKVVIDILEALGISIDCVVDDNPTASTFLNYPMRRVDNTYEQAIITIGNCQIRKKIAEQIKVNKFVSAIHPSASVSPHSEIGVGTVIMQGAIVQ